MDKIKEMEKLIEEIKKHNYNYYVLDNPTISDKEYDNLYYALVELEKQSGIVLPNSPTQKVGDKVLKGFKKHHHEKPLYSLDKRNTYEELEEWAYDIDKKYGAQKYNVEYKFDGLRIAVTYENGVVKNAATRGNGEVGEDVTQQVLTVKSLPKKIPYKGHLIIMGEAMMKLSVFNEYNRKALVPLKNARNGVAGGIRTLDLEVTKSRNIDIFFYDILVISSNEYTTQQGMHEFIKQQGFLTDYFETTTANNITKLVQNIDKIRTKIDVLIDGAVIKLDNLALRDEIGYTSKFPKWAIAFKYEAEELTSILNNIVWQVGRTGKITPIAEIQPIELAGATVKRATLNNYGDIVRKGVKIGSRVFVRRSNEVIPEILGVAEIYDNNIDVKPPTNCPCCNSVLVEDGANLFCRNDSACREQITQRLCHYASRNAMNIEGVSEKTINLLYDNYCVNTIEKLYTLTYDMLANLEGFKDKKVNNTLNSIEKSKTPNFSNFIYSLGILGVGAKTAKDLAKTFNNINDLANATFDELIAIDDIGDIIANNIIEYFEDDFNIDQLNNLLTNYISIVYPTKSSKTSEITGKTFVLTGTLPTLSRDQATALIEEFGGKVLSSVSKNTNYVLAGENAGSKLDKAKQLNVRIIDEDMFKNMTK